MPFSVTFIHSFFLSFIRFISIQPQRPGWQEPEPSHVTGMALAHCILGKVLGVVCHYFPPPLDVPTFAARCLYVRNDARDPSSERCNCGREICPVILPKFRLPLKFRDLLHAANLRHGTDGFTSPPKAGVLRIFCTIFIEQKLPVARRSNKQCTVTHSTQVLNSIRYNILTKIRLFQAINSVLPQLITLLTKSHSWPVSSAN